MSSNNQTQENKAFVRRFIEAMDQGKWDEGIVSLKKWDADGDGTFRYRRIVNGAGVAVILAARTAGESQEGDAWDESFHWSDSTVGRGREPQ